jgi:hypothetical protein
VLLRILCIAALLTPSALAAEADALSISRDIRARHMPFSTILDPIYDGPGSSTIAYYTRCGDSALWTGVYMAAEAYRFNVTRNPEALENVREALRGLRLLTDVSGTGTLARCAVPVTSPFAPGIVSEEKQNGVYTGIYNGQQYYWIGNTSRDQYSGVFFGLATTWDLIDEVHVRGDIGYILNHLLETLDRRNWQVRMPDGSISTIFDVRPDQQLTLLQIGRHINPNWFESRYNTQANLKFFLVPTPIGIDAVDKHESYFKFNLAAINLFSLLRLENSSIRRSSYRDAYNTFRNAVKNHGNAHFNMIEHALLGPDPGRDAETVQLLEQWLKRSRRDFFVDLRERVRVCGDNRACEPVGVEQRVPTDFLWQRSPFQLWGGGDGFIESAGIDYILPYWMGRYYGVIPPEESSIGRERVHPSRPSSHRPGAAR